MSISQFNRKNGFVKTVNNTVGKGVYALQNFNVGDIVLYFHGPILRAEEVDNFDLGLQVGNDLFMMSAGDIDDYVNHSCNPNTVLLYRKTPFGNQWCLIGIKPITMGQQITFDYSITMSGGYWSMCCKCGSKNCRKIIGDFETLPLEKRRELTLLQS